MKSEVDKLRELGRLIADDGHAMTFQSLGQYRSALLKTVAGLIGPAPVPAIKPAKLADLRCRYCGTDVEDAGGLVKRDGCWVCDDCDKPEDDRDLDVEGWEERRRQHLAEAQEY